MEATDRRELLERELDRAVDLRVNDYGADRIYLFGSLVSNRVSEVSDLDLVVVKESNMVFLDRIAEVLALIDPRVGMDVLVYTPSEFERLMADRSFVRNEMTVEHGYCMSEKINRWLVFAEEDLRMAEIALEHGLFNQVCFHVQQCAEKSLKADLVESGSRVPKSHKMADLLSPSNDLFEPALRKEALLLDRFYIPTRYPDALPG